MKFSTIVKNSQNCWHVLLLLVCLLPGSALFADGPGEPAGNHRVAAAPPPSWSVNPLDFEFNMNLVIRVNYQGAGSNNTANVVGAFVGNELRGVATATVIGGVTYYFTTVYSNVYVGETVHFQVYYAPDDAVYPVGETQTFLHNKNVGNTGAPFKINIDPNADYPPMLLNIPADTTLVGIPFSPLQLADYLVSIDNDPVTWSAQAGPNLGVMLVNGVLTVTPVSPVWTGTDLVRIIVTENTANQLADTVFASFTVLPDYGPPVWQVIPNQTIFPGGAFTPFDLDNYLTFNGPCRQFDFDVFPFTGMAADPAWVPVVPGAQPMTVIARPLFADVQLAGPGAKLAAFVNGVLAGWATPTGVSPNVSYNLVLNNVGAGAITFQFYDAQNQYLYSKLTNLMFSAGGSTGTISAPYVVQLSPLVPSLASDGTIQIAVVDTAWRGAYPIDFIVWDCHFPTLRRDTTQAIFSITTDNRPDITSPATVNYEENACSTLYDAQTSDPTNSEGAGLTYSLAGGTDVSRFLIDAATGVLSWATGFVPNFETPADANADNHYQVNVRVTNAANLSDTLALTVIITNQNPEPFAATINGGGAGVLCTTSSVTLQAGGGATYLWNNGSTQSAIIVNTAGTYTVTVTSSGSCTATASVVIAPPATIIAGGSSTAICIGSPIQLVSTPGGGTLPYASFAWSGPNGYTSNLEDPLTFPAVAGAAGVYTVTLTDGAGCTATASKTIMVSGNSAPTVTAGSNSPVCVGANLLLSSTPAGGSGTYNQFAWAGPNNYVASAKNPVGFPATMAAAGVYNVTVTDNAGCSATGFTTVVVKPSPTIVAASNSPVCVGSTVLLNSTPAGGSGTYTTFQWAGPNSFSAIIEDPAGFPATLAASGAYSVTVTDNTGCSANNSTTLVVSGLPTITAALLNPVCTNGMISLASTPADGSGTYTGFQWTGPNGYSANVEDPASFTAIPAAAGTYTVIVTDQSGCTASASVTVVVNPVPAIVATNNGPVCAGSNITLSSTPSGGFGPYTAFLWTGPDGYVASSEDPAPFSVTSASAGIYQVKVTDTQGCTATTTTTVAVRPIPTLIATSNSPVCTGGSLSLQSTPLGGSGTYNFVWTGPANFNSTLEDPLPFTVTLANAGMYLVTVTDNVGCSTTASTSVSISSLSAPSITATSNSPICGGSNLLLMSTPSGGSGVYTAFSWSGPNNYLSSSEDPAAFQVYTNGAGNYTVTVTDSKNCKAAASVNVVVNGPVSAPTSNSPVCPNGTIQLNGGPVIAGATYAWTGPNNYTSSQRIPAGFPAIPAAAGVYTLIITSSGCSGLGTTTVTIGDITPPVIVCPGPQTVNANATCSGVVGTYSPVSVSDNCAANPSVQQSPVASTPLSGHNDVKTLTLTASDGNGNTASCTFTVTLKDVTPPAITCPANTTIAASETCGGILGAYTPVTLSDNCATNLTAVQSPVATTVLSGHNDFRTVSLTANDGNGNTQVCSFTVTLKDITPPTISCPANVTVAANASCSGTVGAYSAVSVADNCNANPVVTQSPVASTALSGHNDVKTVTLTANDGNGNTANCTFTVTLKDVSPPTITCPANATVAADANCSNVIGAYTPAAVSDNCNANPSVVQSPVASTTLNGHNDVKTVTLTADDGNGNTALCTFSVTLKDVAPPVIVCPANTTVAASAACSGVIGAYSPVSVSDNCAANPTVTQSPAASTTLSGHNDFKTVTLTANDGNGNTALCTFTVTLKDVTPPVITCPANTTIAANASCSGAVGAYSAVSVSDNCNANPTVTQSPAPSTVLNGHNDVKTVTLTANDGNGNTATCSLTVTLKDVTPPVIACPANTTIAANASCSSAIGVYTAVSVSDNCNANPAVTQSPVASTLLNGHNDVKTVTLTADDGNGNTALCTFTVTLKDVTPPTVVCKPFTAAVNAAGTTSIITANVFQSGADNCGTVNQVSVVPNAFTCSNLGPNTVVLTVNDGNGNSASCNAVVTVVDLILPTMICQPLTVYLNAAGTASATAAQINNGSFDNCTLASVTLFPTTFSCANTGANSVLLTGTDQSANSASCQTTVTVLDTIRPTMLCKNATINLDNSGQAVLTVAQINNGSFDNCSIANLALSKTVFNCAQIGANAVTLTGTDPSGNSASCSATVTVQDLIAPMAKCKNAVLNLGANGLLTVLPSAIDNGSSDNCSFSLAVTPSSLSCANLGTNVVTLKATDSSGNTNSCTSTVTVKDVTPPTALCKNVTIFLDSQGKASVTAAQVDNNSTDNCSVASRTITITQFNCSDIGAPVNDVLKVVDGSGNSSTCIAQITVKDNIPPVAICSNVQVTLVNGSVTVYSATLASNSTDNCSVWSYTPVAKTYTSANIGQNNLLITVKDFSGNAATCTSIVTVSSNFHDSIPDQSLNMVIYPNPAAGDVSVRFVLPTEQEFALRVFDLLGKAVFVEQKMGIEGENNVVINRERLLTGPYIVHLQSEGKKAVKKLMIRE